MDGRYGRWTVAIRAAVLGVMGLGLGAGRAEEPLHIRIDRIMDAAMVGGPMGQASDSEFLRRVCLDLTGRIPPVGDVRAFLADPDPEKRVKWIDRLLDAPEFVRHMATSFDVMWMERRVDKHVPGAEWRQYLHASFAADKPLSELAREILSADGADPARRPAAKFFLDRDADPDLLTRDVGRLFFGVDLQCAQCHDHPLIDDYHQRDYHGLLAYVNRSVLFLDPKDNNKALLGEKAEGETAFTSVFTKESGSTGPRLPTAEEVEDPVLAAEDAYLVKPGKDVRPVARYSRRARLGEEIARGDNRAFNANLANRLWALVMGRGLVDPPDLTHLENPPANAILLDELARDLASRGFRSRAFLRELVLTRAYQRSLSAPTDWRPVVDTASAALIELEAAYQASDGERHAARAALDKESARRAEREASVATLRMAVRRCESARAEADRASRDAAAAVAPVAAELANRRADMEAVASAADATAKAITALQTETELADAASRIQAVRDKLTAAMGPLEARVAGLTATRESAAASLAAFDRALDAARQALAAAVAPFAAADSACTGAEARFRDAERRWMVARRKRDDAKLAAEWKTILDQGPGGAEKPLFDERLARLEERWTRQSALAPLKPLTPEQLGWSILTLSGAVDRHRREAERERKQRTDAPSDPAELAREIEKSIFAKLEGDLAEFVRLFGAGPGQPQQTFFATVDQALFLDNGGAIRAWLAPADGSVTARMLAIEDPSGVADELYLSVLSRAPSDAESAAVREALAAAPDQKAVIVQELAWALVASTEFRFAP